MAYRAVLPPVWQAMKLSQRALVFKKARLAQPYIKLRQRMPVEEVNAGTRVSFSYD